MLKLAQKDTFTWPITVEIPADGGKFEKHVFTAEFRRLPRSEIDVLMRDVGESNDPERATANIVDQILLGWNGVVDADGQPVPFSDEARNQVLDIHPVRNCVFQAWVDSLKAGARKN